jgi:multidrug resistance efflux pump
MFLDVDGTIVVLTPTPTLTLLVNTGAVLLSLDLDRRLYLNLPTLQAAVVNATRERRLVDREIDSSITHSIDESK